MCAGEGIAKKEVDSTHRLTGRASAAHLDQGSSAHSVLTDCAGSAQPQPQPKTLPPVGASRPSFNKVTPSFNGIKAGYGLSDVLLLIVHTRWQRRAQRLGTGP